MGIGSNASSLASGVVVRPRRQPHRTRCRRARTPYLPPAVMARDSDRARLRIEVCPLKDKSCCRRGSIAAESFRCPRVPATRAAPRRTFPGREKWSDAVLRRVATPWPHQPQTPEAVFTSSLSRRPCSWAVLRGPPAAMRPRLMLTDGTPAAPDAKGESWRYGSALTEERDD